MSFNEKNYVARSWKAETNNTIWDWCIRKIFGEAKKARKQCIRKLSFKF